MLIPGGLTSVMQLCDLIVNKLFKQYLRDFYYKWRTAYIRRMRATGVTGKLNIKLPRDEMIRFIEASIRKLNRQQLAKPTIRKTFQKIGQDPWVDCAEAFKAHLDSISEGSMYRTILNSQQPVDLTDDVTINPAAATAAISGRTTANTTTAVDDESMRWSVGDRVEVLWEDTNTWFVGTVISVDVDDDTVQVHHDYDGEQPWYGSEWRVRRPL